MHLAVISSTPEVVLCLVEYGSHLTARLADGGTALHLSAERGNVEMIKVLMEKSKEDLVLNESTDEPGFYKVDVLSWDVPCSPLHVAISEGHEDAIEALCNFGSDALVPVKGLDSIPQSSRPRLFSHWCAPCHFLSARPSPWRSFC